MNLSCPACHSRFSLDIILQDEAARDLLALRGSLPPRIWNPLIAYLGLFRSETRALAWDKALKLAREIQALGMESGQWEQLETALAETVESLRLRGGKPLKNHNYLKRVLENSPGVIRMAVETVPGTESGRPVPTSKAAQAIKRLDEWSGDDWLRRQIGMGLSGLVAQNLKFAPAAEIITNNADIWHVSLKPLLTIEEVDTDRIWKGFRALVGKLIEWPQPKQLIELLPPRPQREKIRHTPSDNDYAAGAQALRQIRETLT